MRSISFYWHAALACQLLLQVAIVSANPQAQYYNAPNGQLKLLNGQSVCGNCPPNTVREVVSGPYCGRCMTPNQSCAKGSFMNNGQCQACPCPSASGDRKFGTACRVDVDGQVTCDCPDEYTGRDCGQCAPGTIQNNMYPYNCIRLNSTSSFASTCPAGNRCSQPVIQNLVQPRPTGLCPIGNNGCSANGCNTQCGCPSPCGCPQNGCPGSCPGTTPTCPITLPWTPPPPPPCPGPIQCPLQPPPCAGGGCPQIPGGCPGNGNSSGCPLNPCQNGSCGTSCPGNGNTPCPINPGPCPGNGNTPCPIGPSPCPGNGPCPINPGPCPGNGSGPCPINPGPCPGNGNGPCPIGPGPCPGNGLCPTNPGTCPGNGNSPCNTCQNPTPCQPCGSTTCPNPCPSPCSPCPQIPPCPDCKLTCPPCVGGPDCVTCPNPCQACPNPCQQCPENKCPDCNVSCPQCPTCPGDPEVITQLEVCTCDPRGTAAMVGSQCICKVNVHGARCDQCKKGYFALSSTRPEGCVACFCSGMTDSCLAVPYYRSTVKTDRSANCTIELTDEQHSVVYSQGTAGFSYDGMQASYNKGANKRLFWSLPSCLKGDRVTSYGGYLSFSRMCSGGGTPLGADHEVMLVSGSEATVFWTTFEPQKCDGTWNQIDVLLAEPAYWTSFKGEQYRRATRGDIMEVLADLQLILIRATFTSSTSTTSIRNVSISSVTHRRSPDGIALQVESCSCPRGYRGLSCENCAPGYYRDSSDVSKNIFGACKPCPCGKTAEGCHLSGGQVICSCKQGFTGPTCQDREVITINCDPFYIREMEGANVDFTCSFTTNSKRRLLMKLGKEGVAEKAEETTSITKTIKLTRNMRRVACEIVDSYGVAWATVYCATEIITDVIVAPVLPPRIISVIPVQTFICIYENEPLTLTCDVHSFGPRKVDIEWRREGSPFVIGYGKDMTLHNVAMTDAGTYICSASDQEATGFGQIALMVRSRGNQLGMGQHYPINVTNSPEIEAKKRHGGDFPNHPYQLDAPAVAGNDNITPSNDSVPAKRIDPVLPGHPKAVVDPSEASAKIGSTVVLRCSATGEEPLKFYWKSGSNAYIPSHVRVSHGALIFRSLRSSDAGVYYCIAWNHLGQSSAKATINLDNSISKPIIKENSTEINVPLNVEILHPEITAKPGDNVNFHCRSNTTDVMFHWTKVGEKMSNASEVRIDGLLTLYRVSEKEKGTYQCTVSTASGERVTAQAVLKLEKMGELLVPPRVTISPKSPLRIRTGSAVRLECESTGSPMPNVTWVRSINGKDKKLVTSASNKAIYEIKQMASTDVGKYACNAVSAAGRQSESMSLVIDDGQPCKETEFRCKSGDQCIPREDRCDAEKDCRDGSDEANCKGSRRVRRHLKNKV